MDLAEGVALPDDAALPDGVALPDDVALPDGAGALLANLGFSALLSVEDAGVRNSSADGDLWSLFEVRFSVSSWSYNLPEIVCRSERNGTHLQASRGGACSRLQRCGER